jgi:hypothetical protein
VILANSRPWEGAVMSAPLVAVFLYWVFRSKHRTFGWRMSRVLLPWLLVMVSAAAALSYYCWRITGDSLLLPHSLNRKIYATAPIFIWERELPKPKYNHPAMDPLYTEWDHQFQESNQFHLLSNWPRIMLRRAQAFSDFYFPAACSLILLIAFGGQKHRWLLLTVLSAFLVGSCLQRYFAVHYGAPAIGLVIMIPVILLAQIAKPRSDGDPAGFLAAVTFMALLFVVLVGRNLMGIGHPNQFARNRQRIQAQMESTPGKHLIMVRYSPNHAVHEEWVYNAAEIDKAKVVWARAMADSQNEQLFDYFRNRQVWLLEPDSIVLNLTRVR